MGEKVPAIGIDLGTTYSCVAVYEHGAVEIIANDQGNRTTPSYVAFTERERMIGDAAKNQVASNPENTVFDTKRLIGRRFEDEAVQGDMLHFPFNVVNDGGKPSVEVEYGGQKQKFLPEQISSMILGKMKETAEAYLGKKVTDAVITVPAYFNNSQRQATKNAGEIAGLNVLRVINEPTAAAIAYGLDRRAQGNRNVLVFDLGGGTFDVSMLEINDGVFEVRSTAGDTHLGGEDFDSRMVDYFVGEIKRKQQKDISNDKRALRRLRTACEQAKCILSSATQTTLEIAALYDGIDFTANITRAKFEELCHDLFLGTLNSVEKAIMDARIDKPEIDEVVLVGGSSRIPKIQKLLQEYFDGKELNTTINPEEAIAYGAAVQAAIINGDDPEILQDLLLLDIIPLTLGIGTEGGVMCQVIPRNSPIPNKECRYAAPSNGNATNVIVSVYEGERALAKDNNLLAEFTLNGLRRVDNQDPLVLVTYELDVNGILTVSATCTVTNSQQKVTIANDTGRLSQAQIDQMKRDAEIFQQQDELERKRIEARNFLQQYLEYIKKTLNQNIARVRIPANDRQRIGRIVDETTNWVSDAQLANKEELDAKREELRNLCDPFIRNMHN